jgi:hypothetical protein
MINQPLKLRQMYDEVRQFAADLLCDSYNKQAQGRHAVTFEVGERVMLHTPLYEDGKKIVSVPTRLLKRWSGDFAVIKQPSPSNVVLDTKGTPYVAHVARVLRYKPFVPTQSAHLARLARQVLADAQQSVVSTSAGQLGSAPPLAQEVNAANSSPLSKTISHVTCVPPARTLATVPVSYSAITPAEVAVLSNNPLSGPHFDYVPLQGSHGKPRF